MAPCATAEEHLHSLTPSYTKPSTVYASVLHGPRDLRVEQRSLPDPPAHELQIAIKSTGICGSDVSYYNKFANGDLCACSPLSLGHESSGIVVAIGPKVPTSGPNGFKIGDRVALEVGLPCGECGTCRKGRYNLCGKMRFRSSAKSVPHFQGTLQERINHPAKWCHKLPSSISFDAAALLEPLSVAIHAVNRCAPVPGSTALVMGAGTVGLLVSAMALQSGCTAVTIVDVDGGRVAYALEHGFATHGYVVPAIEVKRNASVASGMHGMSGHAMGSEVGSGASTPVSSGATTPASLADSVYGPWADRLHKAKKLAADILAVTFPPVEPIASSSGLTPCEDEDDYTDPPGVTYTFECTGKETCMQTSIYATSPGGKVIMVGMGTPIQTLPLSAAHLREVDILGVFRYCSTYATGIALLGSGRLPRVEGLVTHRVKGLENVGRAFELASKTCDEMGQLIVKVVVEA